MKKQRTVLLGAAVVLAVSLIGGGSYAWFTARAEAPNLGDLDPSNRNGVRGGIVAGSVDLKVAMESYTQFASDGTRITEMGDYPGLLYPEDIVVLPKDITMADGTVFKAGTILDGNADPRYKVQSVIEYVIENTSQIDIVAQLNQQGITISGPAGHPGYIDAKNDANPIDSVNFNVSKLLGWDYTTDPLDLTNQYNLSNGNAVYASDDEFYQQGPTWFYWANDPKGTPTEFVNHRKLEQYGFLNDGNIYNINAIAKGLLTNDYKNLKDYSAGTPFYDNLAPVPLTAGTPTDGILLTTSIDPAAGADGTVCRVTTSNALGIPGSPEYMYLYMPGGGKTSVKLTLSLPNYDDQNATDDTTANGINIKGNEYQYAVFSLALDLTNGDSGLTADNQLVGYGVQANENAITSFFSGPLYTDLHGKGLLTGVNNLNPPTHRQP